MSDSDGMRWDGGGPADPLGDIRRAQDALWQSASKPLPNCGVCQKPCEPVAVLVRKTSDGERTPLMVCSRCADEHEARARP